MEYLHKNKITHRDLKLENILINKDFNLKIADFGFAYHGKNISCLTEYKGTKTYMAPEMLERKSYDGRKADIFSAGVIIFILVVGLFPFV